MRSQSSASSRPCERGIQAGHWADAGSYRVGLPFPPMLVAPLQYWINSWTSAMIIKIQKRELIQVRYTASGLPHLLLANRSGCVLPSDTHAYHLSASFSQIPKSIKGTSCKSPERFLCVDDRRQVACFQRLGMVNQSLLLLRGKSITEQSFDGTDTNVVN